MAFFTGVDLGLFLVAHLFVCALALLVTPRRSGTPGDSARAHAVAASVPFCAGPLHAKNGRTGADATVNCDTACAGAAKERGTFRAVTVTGDTFVDGRRPARLGVYCVHVSATVTECNTATSRLVRGATGAWSCVPMWPRLFGGADGGDILACGGKLTDGENAYEYRLPPSRRLRPITDPYAEVDRFRCTSDEYVGPSVRDHIGNRYLRLADDRFKRVRNDCAKYVANALEVIGPADGPPGYCNCLSVHGRLRRRDEGHRGTGGRSESEGLRRDDGGGPRPVTPVIGGNRSSGAKPPAGQSRTGVVRVPHACSPCIASGRLDETDGVFNFPVGCTKANQKYFEDVGPTDRLPCGLTKFASPLQSPCVNTTLYVGHLGTSYALKRALHTIES